MDIGRKATVQRGEETLDGTPDEWRARLDLTEILGRRLFRGAREGSVRQGANVSVKMPGPFEVYVFGSL
jgi:hypothetical protein